MQAAGQKRPWVRWFHGEDIPRRGQSRETRSRSSGCRGMTAGGHGVSSLGDRRVLELDGGYNLWTY